MQCAEKPRYYPKNCKSRAWWAGLSRPEPIDWTDAFARATPERKTVRGPVSSSADDAGGEQSALQLLVGNLLWRQLPHASTITSSLAKGPRSPSRSPGEQVVDGDLADDRTVNHDGDLLT
jgi:hypothetical protein